MKPAAKNRAITTLPELLQYVAGAGITAAQAAQLIGMATGTFYEGTDTTGKQVAASFMQLLEQHPPPAELPLFFQ